MPVLALSLCAQQDDPPLFRSEANFINVDVQVLSQNKPVLNLSQKDFRIWDNGEPQVITNCGSEDQVLDIMLLLDVTGSTVNIAQDIRDSASRAMVHLYFRDRVGVSVFNTKTYLATAPTWDRIKVDWVLQQVPWLAGGTDLNRPIFSNAVYLMGEARPEARRSIIVLTDNHGARGVSDETVRNALWESDIVLNALLFRTDDMSYSGQGNVRNFVKATGGETLRMKANDVPLAEMFRRLRQRYSLMYRAPDSEPGVIRTIKVDLTPQAKSRYKSLTIRARSGYVAGKAGSTARRSMKPAKK
jgi:VWFA-related protein